MEFEEPRAAACEVELLANAHQTPDVRCGSKAGIVEHDARGLGYSRSYPDSGPALAGARHGRDGPTHEVAARQPAARGHEPR